MTKIFAAVVALVVAGCATTDHDPKKLETQRDLISKIEKVELFYNESDEWVVIDGGGTGWAQMSGALGPLGMLAVLGAEFASKAGVADRVEKRSKEFKAAIDSSDVPKNLNQQYALKVAELIQQSGRDVKLTATPRAKGTTEKMALPEGGASPGYAAAILRMTHAYRAATATANYTPVSIVEYRLLSSSGEPVTHGSMNIDGSRPQYLTYAGLLADHVAAYEGVQSALNGAANKTVYTRMFLVP